MLAEVGAGGAMATLGETLKPPPQYTGPSQVTMMSAKELMLSDCSAEEDP